MTIEVPAEEVKAEYEKAYEAYMRHVKVPGFRPGRVPRSVIKQRFAKDVRGEVLGQLVPHALSHAIGDHKIRMVGEPSINPDEISLAEGEPLRFKAGVEVFPEFELANYRGLKVTKTVTQVSDESVEEVINYWREAAAEFVPVEDRPSQLGDFVSVNLVGKYIEPAEEEDLKSDDLQVELGAEGVQSEFTENLTGVKAGDVKEFRVKYPEDFTSKGLAGKTLDFTTTVVAVRRKELPEPDDEFAKGFSQTETPYETMAEMRDKVRADLVQESERRAAEHAREDLISAILKDYSFEIPPTILHQQQQARSNEFINRLLTSGLPLEELRQIDIKGQIDRLLLQVERELRTAMVFERIAEVERIEIGDDDAQSELERRARAAGKTVEEMIGRLTREEALSSIKNSLLYEKTMDLLMSSAEIDVEEITPEEARKRAEKAETIAAAVEPAPSETAGDNVLEEPASS